MRRPRLSLELPAGNQIRMLPQVAVHTVQTVQARLLAATALMAIARWAELVAVVVEPRLQRPRTALLAAMAVAAAAVVVVVVLA